MNCLMKIGLFSLIVFLLIGCSDVQQEALVNTINDDNGSSVTFSSEEKPPSLTFKVGETAIKTYRGTYSWNYRDKNTGQTVGIEADSLPPFEIVNIEKGMKFDLKESIHLNFEVTPINYEIRVWNNQTTISTYNSFEEIKERGKYIIEIVGYWATGSATYVSALDIYS